jgi:uncharacterized coiled-coil protein SlyX
MKGSKTTSLLVGLACTFGSAAGAAESDLEARIRQLEAQVRALTQALEAKGEAPAQPQRMEELEAQVEALTEEVESRSGGSGIWERLHLSSYGELHYNNLNADDETRDKKEIDLHRFVLGLGWDFTDRLRFFSEIEFEHAFQDKGEWEVEQAYIQYDITENQDILGGIYLLPVGILNPTHEPTTFYGVERNPVENVIIPTTWWAAGANYQLRFGEGFSWDIGLHEGLKMKDDFRVRGGRQKSAKALAKNLAGTTRIRYTGFPGLELAASLQYQSDPGQGEVDGLDSGWLTSVHAVYQYKMFGLRALYGRWDFSGDAVEAAGADVQQGWYVEPSVKFWNGKLGLYFRYSDIPDAGRSRDEFGQWETGLNFWPHPGVVLKVDVRGRNHHNHADAGRDFVGFDLGIGYAF